MGDAVSHTFRQMQNGTGLFYGWFEAMHSRFDLLTVGPTENEAAALCRDIAAEIRRIENRLNRFDEASDVWQINQNTFYDKCPADPELLGIFADALRYREMTGGAFDIAIQTPEYLPGESCFAVDPACEAVVKLASGRNFRFRGIRQGIRVATGSRHVEKRPESRPRWSISAIVRSAGSAATRPATVGRSA